MQETYLIGGGGLGRELVSWIRRSQFPSMNIVGCFDDNLNVWEKYKIENISVLGTLADAYKYDRFLAGIMDVEIKESLFVRFKEKEKRFVSFLDSDSIIGERASISEGVTAMPNVIISCDTVIGNLVTLNIGTQIGHDTSIGDFCSLMASVNLGGNVTLGKKVFIGTGATILPGVKVPAGTRIGAGSVVVKSIKEPGTYFGNPAKRIF